MSHIPSISSAFSYFTVGARFGSLCSESQRGSRLLFSGLSRKTENLRDLAQAALPLAVGTHRGFNVCFKISLGSKMDVNRFYRSFSALEGFQGFIEVFEGF